MIVYEMCRSRFGVEDKEEGEKRKAGPSRRQLEIANIRKRLRQLRKRFKEGCKEEKKGLEDLRLMERSRLKTLRQAERVRKKAREKRKARGNFLRIHTNM